MDIDIIATISALVPILFYLLKLNNEVVRHNVLINELKGDIKELKDLINCIKKQLMEGKYGGN